MQTTNRPISLNLEVEEVENRGRPGGCSSSSTTSPLCTCPCTFPGGKGD